MDKQTWVDLQKQEKELEKQAKAIKGAVRMTDKDADPGDGNVTRVNDSEIHERGIAEEDIDNVISASGAEAELSDRSNEEALLDDTASTPIQSEAEAEEEDKNHTTVFVRNLPFTVEDETLRDHFKQFGSVRYARVVYDPETERSRGTGFVCFLMLETVSKRHPNPTRPSKLMAEITDLVATTLLAPSFKINHSILLVATLSMAGSYK